MFPRNVERLDEIKDRLDRFWPGYTTSQDFGWLIAEVERLRLALRAIADTDCRCRDVSSHEPCPACFAALASQEQEPRRG